MSNVFMQCKICSIVMFSSLITYSYFVYENQIEKKKKKQILSNTLNKIMGLGKDVLTLTQLKGAPSELLCDTNYKSSTICHTNFTSHLNQ